MPVIEAQYAPILMPHDHRHINHVSETWGSAPRLKLLTGALAHGDLWPRPGEAVPGRGAPRYPLMARVTAGPA